jgi:hypothetical protein
MNEPDGCEGGAQTRKASRKRRRTEPSDIARETASTASIYSLPIDKDDSVIVNILRSFRDDEDEQESPDTEIAAAVPEVQEAAQSLQHEAAKRNAPLIRDFAREFFKRKDVIELIKRLPNKKLLYATYAREYIVWSFWKHGADATADATPTHGEEDDAVTTAILSYLTTLVQQGAVTQDQARNFSAIGTASGLERYLTQHFVPHRDRYFIVIVHD